MVGCWEADFAESSVTAADSKARISGQALVQGRRRFNRDTESPAELLGYVDRRMEPTELLSWRQDWGRGSIHPLSRYSTSIERAQRRWAVRLAA